MQSGNLATMKTKILFITAQIVYPQFDGGKKSTLGRIMKCHASGAETHVVSFNITGQEEKASGEFFKKHSIGYTILTTKIAKRRKNKSLFIIDYFRGIFSLKPRFAQNHIDPKCSEAIQNIIFDYNIDDVYFDSLWTAESTSLKNIKNPVLIEHNLEYIFLKEMAKCESNILLKNLTYFESSRTRFYEKNILKTFPRIIFLSDYDRDFAVKQFSLEVKKCAIDDNLLFMESRVKYLGNENYILFTGSLDFKPNLEGVKWFLSKCFTDILKAYPELKLLITGSASAKIKKQILKYKNVEFTGLVADSKMTQLQSGCKCIISPILSGSGIKIKNIEALQAGAPVVMTEFSSRGIKNNGKTAGFCKTNTPVEFTKAVLETLS
jgi:glycosyltransferase involved in cell wall biosynthesis